MLLCDKIICRRKKIQLNVQPFKILTKAWLLRVPTPNCCLQQALFSLYVKISTSKSIGGKCKPSLWIKCSYIYENIRHFLPPWLTNILSLTHKRTGTLHNCTTGRLGAAVPCIQELPTGSPEQATEGDTTNLEKVEECCLN